MPDGDRPERYASPAHLTVVIFAYLALYFALDWLDYVLPPVRLVSPWHMVAGLTLAFLLLYGVRMAPIAFVAVVLSALFVHRIPITEPAYWLEGIFVTFGYTLTSWLLRDVFRVDLTLRRMRDIGYFALVTLASTLIIGEIAVTILVLFNQLSRANYIISSLYWWLGDAIGIFTLTPFLLLLGLRWSRRAGRRHAIPRDPRALSRQIGELAAWLVSLVVALWAAFGSPISVDFHLFYFTFLPLLWLIIRYGIPGTAIAVLVINTATMLAIWIFSYPIRLPDLQIFMLTLPLTGLYLGGAISERQLAEERQRESEARLQTLSEAAFEGILIHENGKIIDANRAFTNLVGYSLPELIGRSGLDFVAPDSRDAVAAHIRSGSEEPYEAMFLRRNGEDFIGEVRGRLMILDDRSVRVVAIHDITERKQAEDALEAEHTFLSSVIDLLPFPINIIAPRGEVIQANEASYAFFPEPDPQEWWRFPLLSPETRTPIPMEEWPVTRSLHGEVIHGYEAIRVLGEENEVPVLIHSTPIYIHGRLVAVVVAFQDITALKEADRAKDQFLAILSHELLNPLTNIIAWVQAAADEPEILSQTLEVVERNAKRQRDLLRELFDVSRMMHGKFVIRSAPLNLWTLVEQTVEDYTPRAQERQITLTLEPPDGPLTVAGDQVRLRQVISNLLTNALKFTDPGGTVTITGRRSAEMAMVAVRDTGRGIPAEMLPSLFKPFKQIKPTEMTGGMGLGLALVKGIVELHGGRIFAESPGPGKGSTFTVELPLSQ